MAEETKLNWQSLTQFLAVMAVLITCAVAIEHRFTALEVKQDAPLTDKQKAAIKEYVTELLKQKNQVYEDDGETETVPKKPATKPKPRRPKVTGQASPLRATDPLALPPFYQPHSWGN